VGPPPSAAAPVPQTPAPFQDVLVIGSSAVAAAPSWMRRSAKAGHESVQVREEVESAEHSPSGARSAAELLAAMRQGSVRQP